jgi:hypothetical protein
MTARSARRLQHKLDEERWAAGREMPLTTGVSIIPWKRRACIAGRLAATYPTAHRNKRVHTELRRT